MQADVWLSEFVQHQDEAAFEALFREYYPRITRLLVTLVGDQAEDVAQATFLQLYRHPPRESTEVGAWLYRVATHLGYNALRGQRRWRKYRDTLATLTGGAGWQDEAPAPEEWTQQRETEQQVRAALRQLKEREATVLALRYSGQSYQEIAAVLGVSVGSVGTLLARAERAFSKAYARMGQEADR